jgi:hypothetical protein
MNSIPKLSKHPGTGKRRLKAGQVKILAIDHDPANGAPTIALDFEDVSMPGIDFGMAPVTALRLFDLLMRPAEEFWTDARSIDLAATPADRAALDCGEAREFKVIVATATGIPTFTVEFRASAPIPAIEFSLTAAQAVTLLHAVMYLATTFGWVEAIAAAGRQGAATH